MYAVSFANEDVLGTAAGVGKEGAAAEVGVAVSGVGGAVSAAAERGVDWREEERRSRGIGAFLPEPFLEAGGAMAACEGMLLR